MIHAIRCLSIRLVLILIAWVGTFSVAFAAETDRVLVVRNGNSAISRAVADDYAQRRGIRNVITLTCPDAAVDPLAEAIDFASYQTKIETPLLAFLAAHPGIDFIVLTKGLPLRLRGAAQGNGVEWFSLDSHLAVLGYDTVPAAIRIDTEDPDYRAGYIASYHRTFHAQAWANRFWN